MTLNQAIQQKNQNQIMKILKDLIENGILVSPGLSKNPEEYKRVTKKFKKLMEVR